MNQLIKAVVAVPALHGNVRNGDSQAPPIPTESKTWGFVGDKSVFLKSPPEDYDACLSLRTLIYSSLDQHFSNFSGQTNHLAILNQILIQ